MNPNLYKNKEYSMGIKIKIDPKNDPSYPKKLPWTQKSYLRWLGKIITNLGGRLVVKIFLLACLPVGMALLPSLVFAASMPNSEITPGDTDPILNEQRICSETFHTSDYRYLTLADKRKIFSQYQIPWTERKNYEVDHLVPLELGGSNSFRNLWPQPCREHPGCHEKDWLENRLHREVCDGKILLEDAQDEISTDWYKAYQSRHKGD